jgi:hypothetical protein
MNTQIVMTDQMKIAAEHWNMEMGHDITSTAINYKKSIL